MGKKKKEVVVFENERMYTTSNRLVRSRYYANTLENKMLAFGIARLQNSWNSANTMEVSFSTEEVEMLVGVKDNTKKYQKLKLAASRLSTMTVMVENEKKDGFTAMSIVPTSIYENGTFTMRFNQDFKGMLHKLKSDFTPFPLETIAAFDNKMGSATFRIYQYMKMEIQRANKQFHKKEIILNYPYEEFVLNIGQINTEIQEIRDLITKKAPAKVIVEKAVDLNKKGMKCAVNVAVKGDFKRYVLTPALEEINEKSEINAELISFGGRGRGKSDSVIIKVSLKEERVVENDEKYWDCVAGFTDLVPEINIAKQGEEMRAIIKASGNDLNRIKRVRELVLQMDYVRNFVGAMITGLEEGWDKEKTVSLVRASDAKFYEDVAEEINDEMDGVDFFEVVDAEFSEVKEE